MACDFDTTPVVLPTGSSLPWLYSQGGDWEVWGVQGAGCDDHAHIRVRLPNGKVGIGSTIASAVAHVYDGK